MQLQSWHSCCCWNQHNFTLTKQKEERTHIAVNTTTTGGNVVGQSEYPCVAAWADGSHYFLWHWTLLCKVVSILLLFLLLQAVFLTWQKHGEPGNQLTSPLLHGASQAGSWSCTNVAVGLLHKHFATVKKGLDQTGFHPDSLRHLQR